MNELLVECAHDNLLGALARAADSVGYEAGCHINGFMIQGGVHRRGGGQNVVFWSVAPLGAVEDLAVSIENYPAMYVDKGDFFRVFLRFNSPNFLFRNPDLFMKDFTRAFNEWDARQVKQVRILVRSRRVSKLVCDVSGGEWVSAMVEFDTYKMKSIGPHAFDLTW